FPLNREVQRAGLHVRNLLVMVMMQRHHASFLKKDAGNHDLVAHYKLAVEQRVQCLLGYLVPANVLDPAWIYEVCVRCFAHSSSSSFADSKALVHAAVNQNGLACNERG